MDIHQEKPLIFQSNPQKISEKDSENLSLDTVLQISLSLKQPFLTFQHSKQSMFEEITVNSTFISQQELISQQQHKEESLLLIRSSDDIRSRYLNKLFRYQKHSKVQCEKKHQNIFIFDWDDTVMCSSFINRTVYLEVSNSVRQILRNIDKTCQKIFQQAIKNGYLFIITNAAKGWVQYSSKNYLPRVYNILLKAKHKNVEIRSARALYQQKYPSNPSMWKLQAFKSVARQMNKSLLSNLIIVGDSQQEMKAGLIIAQQFQYVLVKRIRFQSNPSPEQLVKQQTLLFSKFQKIIQSTKNITIELMKKDNAKRKLSDNFEGKVLQF